jgi:hypothetical protein
MSPKTSPNIATAGALEMTGRHGALSRVRHARLLGLTLALMALAALTAMSPTSAHAEECPNAAFRTGPSAHLPDCRAYELVTPPYKNAGYMFRVSSGPEGSPSVFSDSTALPDSEGFQNIIDIPATYYLTERTSSGWVSTAVDLPSTEYEEDTYRFTALAGSSLDGRTMVWQARGSWEAENRIDLFVRRPDRSIADIGPMLPPTAPSGIPFDIGQNLWPEGVSSDGSHVLFKMTGGYWPFDETRGVLGSAASSSLYEYVGTGNTTPMLVGVDNAGKQISQCGDGMGGDQSELTHNAISLDGETVFFTALPDNYEKDGCTGAAPPVKELFARIDNGEPDAHTVSISEPSKEDCATCDTEPGVLANAFFQGASEDGSKVIFSTTQPLLGGDSSNNLYEYDFDAPAGQRVVRISAGDATVSNPVADVQGQFGGGSSTEISEDGSHVYFLAGGVLTRTPNAEGEAAETGANNLYVFERDSQFPDGRVAFIARTIPDEKDITPDGRFLVFTSSNDLTPDDTSTAQQVFEYDAQTASLVRVSIGQDGYNDDGNAFESPADNATIVSPTYGEQYESTSYWSDLSVSADGSYVFFQSSVGLTPEALDRKVIGHTGSQPVYAKNIYEYHDGRVSLISDGQDITENQGSSVVSLSGTDPSGGDVFFSTADRLVGQDVDTDLDVYDARVDGGFPGPTVSPSCSGDTCQGELSATPALLSPGSEFQAGGNPPLAGPPEAAQPKRQSKKRKPAKKKAGATKKKVGKHRAGQRKGKAKKAALRGRVTRKAGRS